MNVRPPVAPMLAKLARRLPVGDVLYEPKGDGFRCLAFRDGDDVDLRSRHDRPFARYFPEVVRGLQSLAALRVVLDGEIVVVADDGDDFDALLKRLHPAASRVARMVERAPASFMAFDLLAVGDDRRGEPFEEAAARGDAGLLWHTADEVVDRLASLGDLSAAVAPQRLPV